MAAPNSFWFSYRLIITTNVTRCGRTEVRPSNKLPPSIYIPLKWDTLTYRNQGRWKEAEELQVQVMETRKMVLRQEYPSTLTSMANLASRTMEGGRRARGASNFLHARNAFAAMGATEDSRRAEGYARTTYKIILRSRRRHVI
jgi:Tetratricopeptide repeat